MNDLQKAQAFLRSGDFSIEKLAKQIGSSSRQLRNYIDGKADLSNAKWAIVHKLAQIYDQNKYSDLTTSPDFLSFISIMGGWFKEILDNQIDIAKSSEKIDYDEQIIPVIQKMNERLVYDLDYTFELYKEFKKASDTK